MDREYEEQLAKFRETWTSPPRKNDFQELHFKQITEYVADFVARGPVLLAGYPRHSNLGDQAIWHAHRVMFRRAGLNVNGLISTKRDIETLRLHDNERTTVIFTGGGSLGDRYQSAAWRNSVMSVTKRVKFIQLPASTTFAPQRSKVTESLESLYAQHNRMMVMCRDSKSLQEAQERLGIKGLLTPDLVHTLPDISHLKRGGRGVLHLLRRDQEIDSESITYRPEEIRDWDDIYVASARQDRAPKLLRRASQLLDKLNLSQLSGRIGLMEADSLANLNTSRALAYLSLFDSVVTDRLHGMLLAEKLGLPVHVIDNNHGKISRYLDSWGSAVRNVRFHQRLDHAIAAAKNIS